MFFVLYENQEKDMPFCRIKVRTKHFDSATYNFLEEYRPELFFHYYLTRSIHGEAEIRHNHV
jgi:hypothetical protein